jgi:ADP-L-glycero-D-manno-heptose 6-epimerase
MMSVVCRAYPTAAADETVKLFKSHHPDYEDGGQLRDFVYVKDCVDVMMWMMDHPEASGIFNLGTGQARSFYDLVNALFLALKKTTKVEYIPMPDHLQGKYQYYTQANIDHLRSVGYNKPMTSLEDGVKDYVDTYLNL